MFRIITIFLLEKHFYTKQVMKKILVFLIAGLFTLNLHAQRLPTGPQVLSIHSNIDDSEQPYALYIPPNFDENASYPLVVMLHGAGSNHRLALRRVFGKSNAPGENDVEASRYFPEWKNVNYIVVAPYARGTAGYQGVVENDVLQVLEDVKSRFKIDENRIYLTGLSMGGGGTLWIGLTRPDIWAAIAPVCPAPPAEATKLIGNALNIPVHFFQGADDPVVPAEGVRKLAKDMDYLGATVTYEEYPGVLHDSWVNAYADEYIFEWFDKFKRNPFPERVLFAATQLKYGKAYWVNFDAINPGNLAEIDATFTDNQSLTINTKKLEAFTLNLKDHPTLDATKKLKILLDGKKMDMAPGTTFHFVKKNMKWEVGEMSQSAKMKKSSLEGPVFDAFSQRHVYVYGTGGNPSEEELAKRRAQALAGANWSTYRGEFLGRMMFFPRVISDKEVRPSDLKDANLILFGTKETNQIIADLASELPIHLSAADKDHGLLYIYPKGDNYVVINSGLSWWANIPEQGYPFVSVVHRNLPTFKDFILFKNSVETPVIDGYFDTNWKLPSESINTLKSEGNITIN